MLGNIYLYYQHWWVQKKSSSFYQDEIDKSVESLFEQIKVYKDKVGTGYFDEVTQVITGRSSSVTALSGSTEEEQFDKD